MQMFRPTSNRILAYRHEDNEAMVEISGHKIIIQFIGEDFWFMHICHLVKDFGGAGGFNIGSKTENQLSYSCKRCGLNGVLDWNPQDTNEANLNSILLQLVPDSDRVILERT